MLRSRRVWLGIGVSLLFLGLFFYKVDLGEMAAALRSANYVYLIPAVALYFCAVFFRTLRWRTLLAHLRGPLPVQTLYPVVVVGYMANNLLPVRLGEVVRAYYLGHKTQVRASAGLATIVVERVFDGLTLLLFIGLAAAFVPLVGALDGIAGRANVAGWVLGVAAAVPFLAALGVLALLAAFPAGSRAVMEGVARLLPLRLRERAVDMATMFVEGLGALRSARRLGLVFLLSLPVWALEGGMYLVLGYAFGIPQALEAAGGWGLVLATFLLLTAMSNLATSIPAAQGSVGTFEFFAAATAIVMGVGGDVARAYAIALHVALLAPVTLLGLAYLSMENLSLGKLARASRTGALGYAPVGREERS